MAGWRDFAVTMDKKAQILDVNQPPYQVSYKIRQNDYSQPDQMVKYPAIQPGRRQFTRPMAQPQSLYGDSPLQAVARIPFAALGGIGGFAAGVNGGVDVGGTPDTPHARGMSEAAALQNKYDKAYRDRGPASMLLGSIGDSLSRWKSVPGRVRKWLGNAWDGLRGIVPGWKAGWNMAPAEAAGMADGAKRMMPELFSRAGFDSVSRGVSRLQALSGFNSLMDGIGEWQDDDLKRRYMAVPITARVLQDENNEAYRNWKDFAQMSMEARRATPMAGELSLIAAGAAPFSLASKAVAPLGRLGQAGKFITNAAGRAAPWADNALFFGPQVYDSAMEGTEAFRSRENYLSHLDELRSIYQNATTEEKADIVRRLGPYAARVMGDMSVAGD